MHVVQVLRLALLRNFRRRCRKQRDLQGRIGTRTEESAHKPLILRAFPVGHAHNAGVQFESFSSSTGFKSESRAVWPQTDDHKSVVEQAVREVPLESRVLDRTVCRLFCVDWDGVASRESAFAAAVRAAPLAVLEV